MEPEQGARVVSASMEVGAFAEVIFELIADPARQREWDVNNNLAHAASGQRVRSVGNVFRMTLSQGSVRENHVVEFEEGRRIAWMPAEPGGSPIGHLWRWEVRPINDERSYILHTYDWMNLHDESRFERAKSTSSERLLASIKLLAELAEAHPA